MGGFKKNLEPKYTIDVNQAKEILGVSRKTIYNRLKSGQLDGKKVATDTTMKCMINENNIQQAKHVKESVEVVEVEENISKDKLINAIQEAVNSPNKEVIDETMKRVRNKIDKQNEAILEVLKENKEMRKELKEIKEQQNKSLWDKIKNIFNK